MPSEYVLRQRIEQAVKDAERANANRDTLAYNRAKAKYDAADKWLTQLESERNDKALAELEAKARRRLRSGGPVFTNARVLPHALIMQSGIPLEALAARGWEVMPGGMRKMDSVNPLSGEQRREVDRDDATSKPDGEHADEGTGDECA